MNKKYGLWVDFFDTEEEAEQCRQAKEKEMTPYMRRKGYYPTKIETVMDGKPTYLVWSRSNTLYCAI